MLVQRLGFSRSPVSEWAYVKPSDWETSRLIGQLQYGKDGWELWLFNPHRKHFVTGDLSAVLVSAEVEGLL